MSDEDEENIENDEEEIDEELGYLTTNAALLIALESLETTDSQQMTALNEGDTSKEIRNLRHSINSLNSILKHNPQRLKGSSKKEYLIDPIKLERFNDLVDDYFLLIELLEQIFLPRYGSISASRGKEYYEFFVPKYEKQVDELTLKETGKRWEEHNIYSDLYLRKFLLKEINKLGYELQGQKALAIVQTLPVEMIEMLQASLNQDKGYDRQ